MYYSVLDKLYQVFTSDEWHLLSYIFLIVIIFSFHLSAIYYGIFASHKLIDTKYIIHELACQHGMQSNIDENIKKNCIESFDRMWVAALTADHLVKIQIECDGTFLLAK